MKGTGDGLFIIMVETKYKWENKHPDERQFTWSHHNKKQRLFT